MKELVNVLNEQGKKIGKVISKSDAHKNNICHGVSVVALIDKEGKLLIQKRAMSKKSEPGKWDLSAAGHIDAGETPEEAALRETYEEINIKIEEKDLKMIDTYLCKIKLDEDTYINHFTYLFIVTTNINLDLIRKQESEVDEVKFVDINQYNKLFNSGSMVEGAKYCGKVLNYMK